MSQVTLRTPNKEPIEPLVLAALEAEKNEILTGILKTKEKLSNFEKKYNLTTTEFLAKAKKLPQVSEMEAIEWSGEYETLKRLEEKLSRLKEIQICP